MTRRAIGSWLFAACVAVADSEIGYRIRPANDADDWGVIDFQFRISDGYEGYLSKREADELGPEWVKRIFRLPGVEALEVRQHSLRIRKADGFGWAGILQPAAKIVKEAMGK